jgi:roadblock/LC7 domain-containing protein
MPNLNDLMALPGALAAFEFSDRGELIESRFVDGSGMTDTVLDLLCHVCVANTSIATMQARGWENMTGAKGFYPVEGFTMIGLDWSTVTHGQFGVIMQNDKVDYQAAYASLGQ